MIIHERSLIILLCVISYVHTIYPAVSVSVGSLPPCGVRGPGLTFEPAGSGCALDVSSVEQAEHFSVHGVRGSSLPTLQLVEPSNNAGLKGAQAATISNVILASTDSFPDHAIDLASLLRPPLVVGSDAIVHLTNVILLHTISRAKAAVAVATLRGVVSDPIIQQSIANWSLNLYTDHVSYVYVGSWSSAGVTCDGCGVFLRFSNSSISKSSNSSRWSTPTITPDEPRPAVNYLLDVNNATFIPSLLQYGSIETMRPFFILIMSNITWGRHPALMQLPQRFIEINRPVTLAGQYGVVTAVDLGMVPNAVHVTGQYSNVTLHGLFLENMALGDKQSGVQLSGLSLTNPFNLWIFYWPRMDPRVVTVNITTVAAHQDQVQYLIYWQVMLSSSDPAMRAQAAWLQRGPGITVWESLVAGKRLYELKFVARSAVTKDTWRTSHPVVFPQLPDNMDDPSLYETALKAHAASPLAAVASSNQQLQNWLMALSGLTREGLAVLLAPYFSLAPDEANSWPPARGITLKAPRTVIMGKRVCQLPDGTSVDANSSSSTRIEGAVSTSDKVLARAMPQRSLLHGMGLSDEAAVATTRCTSVTNTTAKDASQAGALERLGHYPMLDLARETTVLQLQPANGSGMLQMHSLTLVGLAQAPNVAALAAAASPRRLLAAAAGLQCWHSGHLNTLHPVRKRLQRQLRKPVFWPALSRQLLAPAAAVGSDSSGASSTTVASSPALGGAGFSQADPEVWTHLVWAVKHGDQGQVQLQSVAMALPAPEFKRLLAASRAAADGAFELKLQGGKSLAAQSSSYVEDCCLLISNYSTPWLTATRLLFFADPETSRSMPPGYYWPYDGSEDAAASGYLNRGASAALQSAASVAGLVIGLTAAAVLAAVAVWLLLRGRRRRQTQQAAVDGNEHLQCKQTSGNMGDSGSTGVKDIDHRESGCDSRPVADVAVLGAVELHKQRQHSQSVGTNSSSVGSGDRGDATPGSLSAADSGDGLFGSKRWQKLATAISGKVQDIHHQRLRAALMPMQPPGLSRQHSSRTCGSAPAADADAAVNRVSVPASGSQNSSCQSVAVVQGNKASGAVACVSEQQQNPEEDAGRQHVLELKELLGRGTFGTVYRASWQGVDVAVKLLQLPPGAGRTMTESGLFSGEASTAGLLRAACRWSTGAAGSSRASGAADRRGGLLKQEHMAVQEAAIGSCMTHPNIVSVYSISLRPAGVPAPLVTGPLAAGAGGGGGLLLLREEGTAVADAALPGLHRPSAAASLELLPWEMQLVMEYCDQGTLREALDAGLLVDKHTGLHHILTVLTLAHNVACAMAYLHQEHIIHGDLKASNVLLKTCIPANLSKSSNALPSGSNPTGSIQLVTSGTPAAMPAWAAAGATPGAGVLELSAMAAQQGSSGKQSAPGWAAPGAAGSSQQQQQQQPNAPSQAILNAASAAGTTTPTSGMQSLLKCGWVTAKVSDFGLSMCVTADETHVSSVHAGTLTHMAPEMLMQGHCSRASDVYAFGILLWEVVTGGRAFAGIPKPLLGHCVISQGLRPLWPSAIKPPASRADGDTSSLPAAAASSAWSGIVALTERCWAQQPQDRPSFAEIVQQLLRLLKAASSSAAAAAAAMPAADTAAAGSAAAASSGAGPALSTSCLQGDCGACKPQGLEPIAAPWFTGLQTGAQSDTETSNSLFCELGIGQGLQLIPMLANDNDPAGQQQQQQQQQLQDQGQSPTAVPVSQVQQQEIQRQGLWELLQQSPKPPGHQ